MGLLSLVSAFFFFEEVGGGHFFFESCAGKTRIVKYFTPICCKEQRNFSTTTHPPLFEAEAHVKRYL